MEKKVTEMISDACHDVSALLGFSWCVCSFNKNCKR